MSSERTYIVTGGAGFVGSNLVAEILRREPGAHLVVIDDFRSGSFNSIVEACERTGVAPFAGEVIAESAADLEFGPLLDSWRPAAVFHMAAITDTTVDDERLMIRDNCSEGFTPLLWECVEAGVPLVYASSAATYGSPPRAETREPFPVEAAGRPTNVYGFSKWLMECEHARVDRARAMGGHPRAWVVGLRYFNVFGPGESRKGKMASMVYQLARQVLAGKRPRVFTDGEQARDQVHVDDVVDCTLAAAGFDLGPHNGRDSVEPGVYNLGSGRATTFNEIVETVRDALGVPAEDRPTKYFDMPPEIARFYQSYTCADMSLTEAGLGWRPRREPLEAIAAYARYLAGPGGAGFQPAGSASVDHGRAGWKPAPPALAE